MNISLAPEPIFHLFNIPITNSIVGAWVVSAVLIILALVIRFRLTAVPKRMQAAFEMIFSGLYEMTEKVIGRADVAKAIFPYVITAFIFIVLSNWSGLLPGVGTIGIREVLEGKEVLVPLFRAPTTDLNTVIALAIITVVFVQYVGLKYLGPRPYLKKFFNFSHPIYFFVGLIELISEFTRIISFSFRLFGNIFAGEVLITVIFFLTTTLLPYVAILPLPFFLIEMFVGLIQAFVFCFLTIVFTAIAVASHDDTHHEAEVPVLNPVISK